MNKKIQVLSILLVLSLFSFGQDENFEIIQEGVMEYEFNKERNLIYILTEYSSIRVYDTEKKETKEIELIDYKRIQRRDNSLYLSESDTLFVFGASYIYKIFENSFIEEIPFLLEERLDISYYHKDSTYHGKEGELNDFLETAVDIILINSCKIITKANGGKLATRGFNFSMLSPKGSYQKTSSLEHSMDVIFAQGDHRRQVKNGKNVGGEKKQIIYFGDIEIKDKVYSCRGGGGDYTKSICKYKMTLITKDKTYILNSKIRTHRYYGKGFGKHTWTCDLFHRAPTSDYITDKSGNIFILFDSNVKYGSLNLIKLL